MDSYIFKKYSFKKFDLDQTPSSIFGASGFVAAIGANELVGIEKFVAPKQYKELSPYQIEQLKEDGTYEFRRDDLEAKDFYDKRVPNEAKASNEGIDSIINDPLIEGQHIKPHSQGGSYTSENIIYGPRSMNRPGSSPTEMTAEEIDLSNNYTNEIAENSTPGITGDFSEVVGDTFETSGLGLGIGAGFAGANRFAQAAGYRARGRHDLAAKAEEKIISDTKKGAINGAVRGSSVAITQGILGANPITAGIGLVAPDAFGLIFDSDKLSQNEKDKKVVGLIGKAAVAAAVVGTGGIGFTVMAGYSLFSAFNSASSSIDKKPGDSSPPVPVRV